MVIRDLKVAHRDSLVAVDFLFGVARTAKLDSSEFGHFCTRLQSHSGHVFIRSFFLVGLFLPKRLCGWLLRLVISLWSFFSKYPF
jgi:hypothetical protein